MIGDVGRLYAEGTAAGTSDEQLLSRFTAARDRSSLAFEAIVRRHGPMVLETCRRLLGGDYHAAEDAFQATFLVLARRADAVRIRRSGSLGPWLHERLSDGAKARVAAVRREARTQGIERARPPGRESTRRSRRVSRAARRSVAVAREVPRPIVLCYFEGLTHDQAAASLRWPVGTVRGYLAGRRSACAWSVAAWPR